MRLAERVVSCNANPGPMLAFRRGVTSHCLGAVRADTAFPGRRLIPSTGSGQLMTESTLPVGAALSSHLVFFDVGSVIRARAHTHTHSLTHSLTNTHTHTHTHTYIHTHTHTHIDAFTH